MHFENLGYAINKIKISLAHSLDKSTASNNCQYTKLLIYVELEQESLEVIMTFDCHLCESEAKTQFYLHYAQPIQSINHHVVAKKSIL